VVLLVLGVLCVGCGAETTESTSTSGAAPAVGWSEQLLDTQIRADRATVVAIDDEHIVVASTTESGAVQSFAADGNAPFVAGETTDTGLDDFALGGIARFGDRWVTVGSGGRRDGGGLLFEPRALESPDGRTWSPLESTGLEGPAEITGIVSADNHVVAVGALRLADDPARGGFRPVAWWSADSVAWTAATLPLGGAVEGSVHGVTATDEEVLAVGRVDDIGTMWSSTDNGVTWEILNRGGMPPTSFLGGIEAQGDVVVVSGSMGVEDASAGEPAPVRLRSADRGRTWREVAAPPAPNRAGGFPIPISSGGGRFFGLRYSSIEAWAEPELCYAEIERCRHGASIAPYVSTDGDRWTRVDTSGIGEGDAGEIDHITATDGGRIIALRRVLPGTSVWTWPAGRPLPLTAEAADPTSEVQLLAGGERPERGRRYGVPLSIHCGMDWLYVGGEHWQRTDAGPEVETGAGDEAPDEWPVAQQTIFGFVTLVDDDLIEYSVGEGEVIATYAPATVAPPGCD
jgi:hypothetical protein